MQAESIQQSAGRPQRGTGAEQIPFKPKSAAKATSDSSMSSASDTSDDSSDSEEWLEPLCKTLQWDHRNPKKFRSSFFESAENPDAHFPNLCHRHITTVPHPLPTSQQKLLESLFQWLHEGQKADGTNLNRETFEQALLHVFQKDDGVSANHSISIERLRHRFIHASCYRNSLPLRYLTSVADIIDKVSQLVSPINYFDALRGQRSENPPKYSFSNKYMYTEKKRFDCIPRKMDGIPIKGTIVITEELAKELDRKWPKIEPHFFLWVKWLEDRMFRFELGCQPMNVRSDEELWD